MHNINNPSKQLSYLILLLTTPFTQLNTPYPATAYLKGFLNTKNIPSVQVDLGLEVVLALFTQKQLQRCFDQAKNAKQSFSENAQRIIQLQVSYLELIEEVLIFLQGKNPTLAYRFASLTSFPKASRFNELADAEHTFGTMGVQDKAKYYCTLFLEDLADFITECVDPHFGFSRYAEQLSRCAYSFDELHEALQQPISIIEEIMLHHLQGLMETHQPSLVAFSVPFPGNLFSTLRCAHFIKTHCPACATVMGGGFPNTELRSLQEPRVFQYLDYVTLDDGETPLDVLWQHIQGKIPVELLKRTFCLEQQQVVFQNGSLQRDYKQHEVGTPDYSDLPLDSYLSVLEVANPMNRLWSDGRWNKLTMAHGCYWGKCTFCDVHLPYIREYEPVQASLLVDRMEELIRTTGSNGFHFVDEAAPPALMKEVALEIIKRSLVVSWWTNIRFEKSFTEDLCYVLKRSGCVGVSGGLEVASDRLLQLIDKGISIEQVSKVLRNFKQADIMVHAYLMYGYPTQTDQETVDSLEVVRQLFYTGILQSAFWHRFALTVHSPIARNPDVYRISIDPNSKGTFANNDLQYTERVSVDHDRFSFGLKKSLFNYMHGIGLEQPIHRWFEFKVPSTTVPADHIEAILEQESLPTFSDNAKVFYQIHHLEATPFIKSKKGRQWAMMELKLSTMSATIKFILSEEQGIWFYNCFAEKQNTPSWMRFKELRESFEQTLPDDEFDLVWFNKIYPNVKGQAIFIV